MPRAHHSSMSMAVSDVAPRIEARMARIDVPQPISSTVLPCRSVSSR